VTLRLANSGNCKDVSNHDESWYLAKTEAWGTGNWRAFNQAYQSLDPVYRAAEHWRDAVGDLNNLWLCWNVNSQWCLLQQKLVREIGWTPVVGWDPSCGSGSPDMVIPEAIVIDFNDSLQLPAMFMHFPLEFAFLWSNRLAFWHSDFLLSRQQMAWATGLFESLQDGEMAAVFSYGGMRNLFRSHLHRYFELLGCTTRSASRDQFEKGCGWWRLFDHHVNTPADPRERLARHKVCWEHGMGIRYWEKHYGGVVHTISERKVASSHFSVNTVKNYQKGKDKSDEMELNFDLGAITRNLDIYDLLE